MTKRGIPDRMVAWLCSFYKTTSLIRKNYPHKEPQNFLEKNLFSIVFSSITWKIWKFVICFMFLFAIGTEDQKGSPNSCKLVQRKFVHSLWSSSVCDYLKTQSSCKYVSVSPWMIWGAFVSPDLQAINKKLLQTNNSGWQMYLSTSQTSVNCHLGTQAERSFL